MRFCEYMKIIKPFFACSSNERFVAEIFTALCGGSLPVGLTSDDSSYRKRLFSGKQKLSAPIKSFVITNKNVETFVSYCDDNVSDENFILLREKFQFDKDTTRQTVFNDIYKYLLEFAKSTRDEVAINVSLTEESKRKSDDKKTDDKKPDKDNPIQSAGIEINFDDLLSNQTINVCFVGLDKTGSSIVGKITQKWDKSLARSDFWTLTDYGDFNFNEFYASLDRFDIAFIVVGSAEDDIGAFANELFDVLRSADKLALLIFIGDEFSSLAINFAEGKYSHLIKCCSSFAVIDKKTQIQDVSISDVLTRFAAGILNPVQQSGIINLDFADIKTVLRDGRRLHIGFGNASGENRAFAAATAAVMRPITQLTNKSPTALLLNVTASHDVSLREVEEAMRIVHQHALEDSCVICGTNVDDESNGNIKVTLIAAVDESDESLPQPPPHEEPKPCVKEEYTDDIVFDLFARRRPEIHMNEEMISRYESIELIAQGGAGRVYTATHKTIGRKVAIKEFYANSNESINASVRTEIEVLKNVKHSYLPQLYDVIIGNTATWIVMECINGNDLGTVVRNNGAIDGGKLLKYLRQLCDVVHYLHTSKPPIIHGDIKPNNIILTTGDDICLIDFNVSHFAMEQKEGKPLGVTHGYSAPELYADRESGRDFRRDYLNDTTMGQGFSGKNDSQKRGGELSLQSDIYSIGATAFFLATATRPPYLVSDVMLYVKMDKILSAIVERCCNCNPKKRYLSVEAIMKELNKIPSKGFAIYDNTRTPAPLPYMFSEPVSDHTELVFL